MKPLRFTPPYINKRGKQAHRSGTLFFEPDSGIYCYGFNRIPRKLKKQIKKFSKPINKMIWVFIKPDKYQLKDPSFIWLECFKTIL